MQKLTGNIFSSANRPLFFPASKSIESNLPLQILLYFNVYYSFMWVICEVVIFSWKVQLGKEEPTLTGIAIAVWTLFEPLRLSVGYAGNLREKVPQLTAFFLLTIVPQMAVMLYLILFFVYFYRPLDFFPYMIIAPRNVQPFEFISCIIMLVLFLGPQVILGYRTTRILIRIETQRFYLQIVNKQTDEIADNEAL